MNTNRREFIKLLGSGGLTLYLSACTPINRMFSGSSLFSLRNNSPINRDIPDISAREFYGDNPDSVHPILWNSEAFRSSNTPKKSTEVPLVIIGGGMSGLAAAYQLRHHKPLVLERDSRFGGNSKGQSWRGLDYSIGAAYFVKPEPDSDIERLLSELEVLEAYRVKTGEGPVAIGNSIYKEFWMADTAGGQPAVKRQFEKLRNYLLKIYEAENSPYPDIPILDPNTEAYIAQLDRQNFAEHMREVAGSELHPHIETALEHYCWSSFGASAKEVSAASGLNFYCAEFGEIVTPPGGNSAVAERLLEKLTVDLPQDHLRTNALVYDVQCSDSHVNVSYVDQKGMTHKICARAAIMACPKFVVKRILQGIEEPRLKAIDRLRYRAYLVANVCLSHAPRDVFYDLYMLGTGKLRAEQAAQASQAQGVTDVVCANYAQADTNNTVLTLYRALPYEGGRVELLAPDAYERFRREFENQITNEILPLLGFRTKEIVDLRLTRWGHPLPLAAQGFLADKVYKKLRAPFRGRIFFIEQDNWALPAFETALTESFLISKDVERSFF